MYGPLEIKERTYVTATSPNHYVVHRWGLWFRALTTKYGCGFIARGAFFVDDRQPTSRRPAYRELQNQDSFLNATGELGTSGVTLRQLGLSASAPRLRQMMSA